MIVCYPAFIRSNLNMKTFIKVTLVVPALSATPLPAGMWEVRFRLRAAALGWRRLTGQILPVLDNRPSSAGLLTSLEDRLMTQSLANHVIIYILPLPQSGFELPDRWSGNGSEWWAVQAERRLRPRPQARLHERRQHSVQSREARGTARLQTTAIIHTGPELL